MFNVIGIEKVDYVSKKTNQRVFGTRLHMTYEKMGVSGVCCFNEYISGQIDCSMITVGDTVNVFYNKYGRVSDVALVD